MITIHIRYHETEMPTLNLGRPKRLWAGFHRGNHSTFKETSKGRMRADERRFVRRQHDS